MNSSPKVTIIILNWNGLRDTRECLNSLKSASYKNCNVIVVDNGSSGFDAHKLESEFGNYIKVIRNNKNLGFAGGCNVGIKDALAGNCEYVLLLNNDTIVDANFLNFLVKASESDPLAGMATPKIYYHSKPDTIWFAGGKFHWWTGLDFHIGEGKKDSAIFNIQKTADFLTGCCLLVKRKAVEKTGLLDPDFFIYWEDGDWSFRMRQAGYKLLFVPDSKIWHKVSASIGTQNPLSEYQLTRGRIIFIRKNYSFPRFLVFLVIFFFYKIPIKIISYLFNGKKRLLPHFFRGLKSGLSFKIKAKNPEVLK